MQLFRVQNFSGTVNGKKHFYTFSSNVKKFRILRLGKNCGILINKTNRIKVREQVSFRKCKSKTRLSYFSAIYLDGSLMNRKGFFK